MSGKSDSARNDVVLGMLDASGHNKHAVCALTRADKCLDEDTKRALCGYVRGDSLPRLGGGYVALRNRAKQDVTLTQADADEDAFFRSEFPGLIEEGQASIGCLIKRIGDLLVDLTANSWLKEAGQKIDHKLSALNVRAQALGFDVTSADKETILQLLDVCARLCGSASVGHLPVSLALVFRSLVPGVSAGASFPSSREEDALPSAPDLYMAPPVRRVLRGQRVGPGKNAPSRSDLSPGALPPVVEGGGFGFGGFGFATSSFESASEFGFKLSTFGDPIAPYEFDFSQSNPNLQFSFSESALERAGRMKKMRSDMYAGFAVFLDELTKELDSRVVTALGKQTELPNVIARFTGLHDFLRKFLVSFVSKGKKEAQSRWDREFAVVSVLFSTDAGENDQEVFVSRAAKLAETIVMEDFFYPLTMVRGSDLELQPAVLVENSEYTRKRQSIKEQIQFYSEAKEKISHVCKN